MFRKVCSVLVCCSIIAIAVLAPPPAEAHKSSDIGYEAFNAIDGSQISNSSTAADTSYLSDPILDVWNDRGYDERICHSLPEHAFDAAGNFTPEFLNAIGRVPPEAEWLIARRARSKSFQRSNRSGSYGFTRSRCSGGFCRA